VKITPRGEKAAEKPIGQLTFYERQKAASERRDERGRQQLRANQLKKQKTKASLETHKAGTLEAFRKLLTRKYGSITMAWKTALDVSGDGRLSFQEFCTACRNNDYNGNLKELWIELNQDGNSVTLEDLDKRAYLCLESFKAHMKGKFPNMLQAWKKGLDLKQTWRLEFKEFQERVLALEWEHAHEQGEVEYLWSLLVPRGKKHLTLAEFDTKAAEAQFRGDLNMVVESSKEHSMEQCGKPFLERQANTFKQLFTRAQAKDLLKRMETRDEAFIAADIGARTLDGFLALCVKRFGTILRAWRKGLDVSGDGKLSNTEFTTACRAIGYNGNITKLWHELDDDNSGIISLKELDQTVGDLMEQFEAFTLEHFGGNTIHLFKKLDKEKRRNISKPDFVERMKEFGFDGDADNLFEQVK
jgi:Ca2+-binding EF-hand superfamily protein